MTDATKTDCFAYTDKSCLILTDRVCDHARCKFYKTQKEFDETRTPSRLTYEQREILHRRNMNPDEWLLVDNTKLAIIVCNINTKEQKTLVKQRGGIND